ncbi:MAG: nucleotide sugar dehydrogenase [Deltaproteobacteria bacterium]|nr:nucleotide sugar dehydrogenase [Deltaproteobacteria bacterium]
MQHRKLIGRIKRKEAVVGIIGMGYVGLPLAREFLTAGFPVRGFDIDPKKVNMLNRGASYIKHIPSDFIRKHVKEGTFSSTVDFGGLASVDAIILCVPTPLGKHREPDLSYVINTTVKIKEHLRKGQIVVLESTTYPGTTDEEMLPILLETGLKVGRDFFLGYSPEREDPGNVDFTARTIPKVVSGITENCLRVVDELYSRVVVGTVPVSSTKVAEGSKLLENIYRAVNIALVNEMKLIFDRMGVDIWEIISAASTKPFGFQPFYPGPGLGGHCIPIDPFYLTWKAKEFGMNTKFIELSGEINTNMPFFVVNKTARALNSRGKSLRGAKILLLGMAYKPDVDDLRESPTLHIMRLLEEEGTSVDYNDPHIPRLYQMRKFSYDKTSVPLTAANLKKYDAVIISTAHSAYDYEKIKRHAKLIIDTRNATGVTGTVAGKIWKA